MGKEFGAEKDLLAIANSLPMQLLGPLEKVKRCL